MSNDAGEKVAVSHWHGQPNLSRLKREGVQVASNNADMGSKRKKAKGATEFLDRPTTERGLEEQSEWLIQDYGLPRTITQNLLSRAKEPIRKTVRNYLRVIQWLFATVRFDPLKERSASLAALHTDCSYCNCACATMAGTKCLHCQFYPNSHAARCYEERGLTSGNLAYILRHLPGYEVAGPEMIEAVRVAFKKQPLKYEHNDGQGGYVMGHYSIKPAMTPEIVESVGLLVPNLVASIFSGYEGYLLLLHDGGELQGYGSAEEYTSLVESRLLPVYEEPAVLRQKVPLPPLIQSGEYRGKITRFFHYETICWKGHFEAAWRDLGQDSLDDSPICFPPVALVEGLRMSLGCSPIPLSGEHRFVQITFMQASHGLPKEARDLNRRMVKDLEDPCSCEPPCRTVDSPRLLVYFIVDRDEDNQPLAPAEPRYIRFGREERQIVVDLFL